MVDLLEDWNMDVPSWKYSRNLESPRVSSLAFDNDSKMIVMGVDVTTQVTPELQCRKRTDDISRMDWPAYSPNMNPIEHVWDILGRRIAARQPPPTCLPELWRALRDE
ncbi:DDE_3 domain-containing protein [Trichonephila clavipes]|nr:DDE_3 domain-containing protein [Trichonephila clavipes]